MSKSKQTAAVVALSSLVAGDDINARKAGREEGLAELQASILAHGIILPLAVRRHGVGRWQVIDGNRRLAALAALAAEGHVQADHGVPIFIRDDADLQAREASLAANVVRVPLHPEQRAALGVSVKIAADGTLLVQKGWLAKGAAAPGAAAGAKEEREGNGLTSPLVLDLSAEITGAIQSAVAGNPNLALAITCARLVNTYHGAGNFYSGSHVKVSGTMVPLGAAGKGSADVVAALLAADDLTGDFGADLPKIIAMPGKRVMKLFAALVSLTIDCRSYNAGAEPMGKAAEQLVTLSGAEVGTFWQPTAENYFSRVPKGLTVAAITAMGGNCDKEAKKAALAAQAERLAADGGWLPPFVLTPAQRLGSEGTGSQDDEPAPPQGGPQAGEDGNGEAAAPAETSPAATGRRKGKGKPSRAQATPDMQAA